MPRRTLISSTIVIAAALGGCTTDGWKQMREEFPEVSANCGLRGTVLERDAADRRLFRLVFRQRYNARLQAARDGSLACVEHWAQERGWRVTTAPAGSPQ